MSSAKIEKRTGTHVETILFTRDELVAWRLPDFQREVNANPKVQALKEDLKKNGGILPGMITFGEVDGIRYLIDGQQRREGFLLSELLEGYADTRVCYFDTMAEMAREYVRLNSHLVNMKPDDILRGLEPCLPALAKLREHCGFIGYGNIRRGARSPILSMSAVIRSWAGSSPECPCGGGKSSQTLAEEMTMEDVTLLSTCLKLMHKAWGREPEYLRLWSSINLTLCLWLYRRVVVTQYSGKSERLDKDQFERCLMALSADASYCEWLTGRHLGDHDRSPCYSRIKNAMCKRLDAEIGRKSKFPAPSWAHGSHGNRA